MDKMLGFTYDRKRVCADNNGFQNICGVSVVDHRFEELKRYNISEIFDPTPKEEVKADKGDGGEEAAKTDEKVVVTAETGKEAATDAKPADEGVSSAVKDEASIEANEANEATGQDEGGVSVVQEPDGSSEAP
jgi:hypothetical protein